MSFTRLDSQDITISAESIVAPAWTGQISTLTQFFTSSAEISLGAGNFYYNIYQSDPIVTTGVAAETQFALVYGNRNGSGSQLVSATTPLGGTASKINYGQYRTLINGDEDTDFRFGTTIPNSVYIISLNRARYKQSILPGSFNLTLTSGSNTVHLTDNSLSQTTVSFVDSGRIYDIVSGSNGVPYSGTGFTANSGSFGKFLPDVGVFILNGEALKAPPGVDGGLGMTINESSSISTKVNINSMYDIIKAGGSFKAQSEETITSNYVFIRVRNGDYNYSTNPSIITGSGELRHSVMVNSPQAYITTVGLYNDSNDLLGVAKLSKPLLKDFTKEALIRIKLDY